jgi:hypothetical protein
MISRTVFAEATVGTDGALRLTGPAQALTPGARVLLTISPLPESPNGNASPLLGSVLRYDDPFAPA